MRFWVIFLSFCVVFLAKTGNVAGESNDGHLSLNNKGRLLQIATKITSTRTLYSIITNQVFNTCVVNNGLYSTGFCAGGRRRRRSLILVNENPEDTARVGSQLGSSGIGDVEIDSSLTRSDNFKSKRLFGLTLWKTTSVISTITVATTNTAINVSLSLVCIGAGALIPPICPTG